VTPAPVSFGCRLRQLADRTPSRVALIVVPERGDDRAVTVAALEADSNRLARLLAKNAVGEGDTVAIGLGNSVEFVLTAFATWKLGGCVLPIAPKAPPAERDQLLALGRVRLAVADWEDAPRPTLHTQDLDGRVYFDDGALPDVVSAPGKATATGGSTGRPKLVVGDASWVHLDVALEDTLFGRLGLREGQRQLVAGPLHHGFGFDWTFRGLLAEQTVVLMAKFDAERAVAAIERHRIEYVGLVPTMMRRMLQLPDLGRRDLSSIEAAMHTGAPCPPRSSAGGSISSGGSTSTRATAGRRALATPSSGVTSGLPTQDRSDGRSTGTRSWPSTPTVRLCRPEASASSTSAALVRPR